ncbi:MAG TPA: transglycosylase SLT domain-containing protein [Anaeromyxobacter sp.]|nr:transglycosylase SLT domain-containing protein [Anaeromyxobacter sp.]
MIAALASLLALLTSTPTVEPDSSSPAPGDPGAALVPPLEAAPLAPSLTGAPSGRIGDAELSPAFKPGSAAAEGRAAYEAGKYSEAVGRLGRAAEPEASYLRALALLELDRYGEALRALDGLEAALPALSDRARFLRGEALAGAGRKQEAAQAWASVPDGSLLAPEARLGQARLLASLGDRPAALSALGALRAVPAPADPFRADPAATALLLAGRIQAAGPSPDLAGARQDYLTCWVSHPLAPEAAECQAALRSMAMPFGVPPGPEEVLQRAENLLEQNRNGAALALLTPLEAAVRGAAPTAPLACRIRSALGRAERRERNYTRAIELLRPVVSNCTDRSVRARSLYVLAGAVAVAGERSEGVALYRRMAAEYPDHPYADDALLYAALLLARDGQDTQARELLEQLLQDHPEGDQNGEARFLKAWLARRAGELDEAVALLEAIERDEVRAEPYDRARAAYWRARILRDRGPLATVAASSAFAELATRYPTDYYGLLARARLAEVGSSPPLLRPPLGVSPASYDPGPFRDDAHLRAGLVLFRMGLFKAASEELEAVPLSQLGPADSLDPVLLVADILDRMGEHRAAHNLLRTRAREAFRRPPDAANMRAWLIAYPPAFREDVERFAQAAAVPANLLQALMREESALDPRIVSQAGAIGLTQLMPSTAQAVAARMRVPRPGRAELMQPSLNIRLGAQYLGELIRHFGGDVALALAAYNAGSNAVDRWRAGMPGLPLDEFVEQIPVEETRGYVKRVLRSYAAYATLYGEVEGGASEIFRVATK